MTIFGNYARYYDLLYQDKDYFGEVQFIHQLIQMQAQEARYLLDLGCGTGIHATLLAQEGYQVHGVDLSQEMLKKAAERVSELPPELASKLSFSQGDIRQIRLNQTFDVITSLFHVISYQANNDDLLAAFQTVKAHLKPGGIFIFDAWYGPAVLREQPSVRIKRLEDEKILVTRIAEPVMYPNNNWVDVNYQVFIRDKTSGSVEELKESHRMRYLFKPEIDFLLSHCQMNVISCYEWMRDRKPGFDTWSVCFIAT